MEKEIYIFKKIVISFLLFVLFSFLNGESILKFKNEDNNKAKESYLKQFFLSAYNPPYAWYGPPYKDSVFTYYEEANFDTLLWVRDDDSLIKFLKKYKFKYLISIRHLFMENDSNGVDYLRGVKELDNGDEIYNVTPQEITEDMLKRVDYVVRKYKDEPNLIGYWICDEPFPSAYKNIAKVVERIRKNDPYHYSLINIGDNEYTTEKNMEKFINTTKIKVLCYDRYNFFNGYDLNDLYFERISMMRKLALKYSIPFFNIVQAVGTNGTLAEYLDWRTPNRAEHRWLAYTSLVYGVHGIVWFHWDHEWGVTGSPDREQIYSSLKSINSEIKALGKVMVNLASKNVYHTNGKSYGEDKRENRRVLIKPLDGSPLIVGFFMNEENGDNYFMLMNESYKKPVFTEVRLNFNLDELFVFNVENEKWEEVKFLNGCKGATFKLYLRKGGGKLFRFSIERFFIRDKKKWKKILQ